MSSATVTIPIDEYMSLQRKVEALEGEIVGLQKQVIEARAEDPSGRVAALLATVRALIPMGQFAVANLPPETIGWPCEAIDELALGLESLPDTTQIDREMAIDLRGFARECRAVIAARAERQRSLRTAEAAVSAEKLQQVLQAAPVTSPNS